MRIAHITLLTLIAALVFTACGKKPVATTVSAPPPVAPSAPPPPPPPAPPAPEAPRTAALSEDELFAQKTLAELNGEAPLRHAFFELDSAQIREADLDAMQANARWLQRWPSTRVTIEGHGDSRGTSEYNLALGDRRAAAVRAYLLGLGVDSTRLDIVSKGEEQPFCFDEHESCWQSNRRGHFVITAK